MTTTTSSSFVVRPLSSRLEVSTTHFHNNVVETRPPHPQRRSHLNGVANWPQPVMTASSSEALVAIVVVVAVVGVVEQFETENGQYRS